MSERFTWKRVTLANTVGHLEIEDSEGKIPPIYPGCMSVAEDTCNLLNAGHEALPGPTLQNVPSDEQCAELIGSLSKLSMGWLFSDKYRVIKDWVQKLNADSSAE